LYMNEENGQRGAAKYTELAQKNNENHVFALESDAGGFTPRGFSIDTTEEKLKTIQSWAPYFEPYLVHLFVKGGSGADIAPLKIQQYTKEFKYNLSLSFPVILGLLGHTIVQLVDNIVFRDWFFNGNYTTCGAGRR